MFVAAGVIAAARWLVDERTSWLVLATLFLAAAALTKNEGLLFAVALLVPLFAVATGRRRAVAISAVVVALVYAPWRVYIAAYDAGSPAYDLSDSLNIPLLARRHDRVDLVVSWLYKEAVTRASSASCSPSGLPHASSPSSSATDASACSRRASRCSRSLGSA